jgi:hypothetical protein
MSNARRRPRTKPTVKTPSNNTVRSNGTDLVELSREQQISDLEFPLNDVICMAVLLSNALNQVLGKIRLPLQGTRIGIISMRPERMPCYSPFAIWNACSRNCVRDIKKQG